MQLAAGYVNDLSLKRRCKLARAVCDSELAKWLEETPESMMDLLAVDVSGALEATRAHRTDELFTIASRASSQEEAASSSSKASIHGHHGYELFYGVAPANTVAGGANPSAGAAEVHFHLRIAPTSHQFLSQI